jgi:hypothetical protein
MDGTNSSNGHKKLYVAAPIYGTVDPHFFKCWHNISTSPSLPFSLMMDIQVGDSLVPRARNTLTRRFLESDATHLLFIDSDLIFSLEHIARIMSHGLDIVGGVYCKKQEGDVQVVCNAIGIQPEFGPDGVTRVSYIGTGFLCISRKVFEVMIQEFGREMWYLVDPDHKQKEYDFWHCGRYEYKDGSPTRYLSEDWWFCQKAMDAGFKVWMDRAVILGHSGNAIYPLQYQQKQLLERFTQPAKAGAAEAAPSIPAETVPAT